MNFDITNMDINILVSIVNMKLRDEFSDLNDLAAYYNVKKEDLEKRLGSIGYKYSVIVNQFIREIV